MDLKTPALQPRQEGPGPRDTDFPLDLDPTSLEGADPPPPSQGQADHPHEEPSGLHAEEHPRGGRRAPAPDLVPLDLSERSARAHPSRRGSASLQAALAVHPCPYCDHKTYYPEVLWVHKRIWHRVSCSSAAPRWIQPNGYKGIRHNLVFLARSGRTGPPPALGGRECQPLPIARFTRTQVPGGAPGPKGSSSPLNVTSKAAGVPRSKESRPGGPCALWGQTRPGPGPEQHGVPALLPPLKARQETSPTPTAVSQAGSQPPAISRPGDKYIVPAVGTSLGPLNKHSAPDPLKAKFSPQPQGQMHGIGDGGPPLPPQEPPSMAGQELRPLASCGGGSRGNAASQGQPVLHAAKQEPASEGHEKRLDILNIFKTYIPKDFATLYQSWGAGGPVPEHRGMLRTQARQGDFICAECGKCFQQPSHLRAHMRAHTGTRLPRGPATHPHGHWEQNQWCLSLTAYEALRSTPRPQMPPNKGETILTQIPSRQCLSEREPRDTFPTYPRALWQPLAPPPPMDVPSVTLTSAEGQLEDPQSDSSTPRAACRVETEGKRFSLNVEK
ncbi:hypothetical protein MC885_012371 [Smutsia gigantea]|nr:hypothetical protein MC885_012371 [Smutsia gigantea]